MDDRSRPDSTETQSEGNFIAAPAAEAPVRRGWRRAVPVLILGIVLAAAAAWFISPNRPASRPAASDQPMPVATATAVSGDIDITLDELGTVTSLATVTIVSQISGYLVSVNYIEGQNVKKGDLLAEIDERPYQLLLAQAEGALERDQALLQNAELDLKRYQDLAKSNSIPRQQLDTQVSLVIQDRGNVISDQAQIDTQKLNISYCHIVSPIDGRVGLRLVDAGNYVTPGQTTGLVIITQMQPITVIFPVAEDNLPQIIERQKSGANLPVTAFDRSGSIKLAEGELKSLDSQINTTTGTLNLRAEFGNADNKLFPNQFVNVRLLVDVLHHATIVPSSAIQRGAPGAFVYLVKKDDTVTVQPVALGPGSGDRVAVQSGLSPGDRVVIDGADKLRNGTKIALRQSTDRAPVQTPPASAPAAGNPAHNP
jgi:multidrug efflux system membrane fusion protein